MSLKYGRAAMAERIAHTFPAAGLRAVDEPITEKHFTVHELGEAWQLSDKTIRSMFWDEPGVLKIGAKRYKTLRIPESVARRVHQKRSR